MHPRFYSDSHEITLSPVVTGTFNKVVPATAAIPGGGSLSVTTERVGEFGISEVLIRSGEAATITTLQPHFYAMLHLQLRGSLQDTTNNSSRPESMLGLLFNQEPAYSIVLDRRQTVHYATITIDAVFFERMGFSETLPYCAPKGVLKPALLWNLADIINCAFTGPKRALYLTAKLSSFCILCAHQTGKKNGVSIHSLNYADVIHLLKARKQIEEDSQHGLFFWAILQKAGLNNARMEGGFKELFGIELRSFVPAVRMEHAFKAIVKGEDSLEEIAARAGLKNYNYFIETFKKHYGITPAIVRKHYTKKVA